jgi:hypothetical protein
MSTLKLAGYAISLITSKVLDARRRGATTEADGAIRRKEERSKATPQMMPCWCIRKPVQFLTRPLALEYWIIGILE